MTLSELLSAVQSAIEKHGPDTVVHVEHDNEWEPVDAIEETLARARWDATYEVERYHYTRKPDTDAVSILVIT